MEIQVLVFGVARDYTGQRQLMLNIPENIRVGKFREIMETRFPGLKTIGSYAIAINKEYAEDNFLISVSDELAIIPPVSGG